MLTISTFSSLASSEHLRCSQVNRKTDKQWVECYMYGIDYKEAGMGMPRSPRSGMIPKSASGDLNGKSII